MTVESSHHADVATGRPARGTHDLRVDKVSTALGAEISNVHLGQAARSPELIAEIRRLLLEHKVLFFRDQDITPAEHVQFARCFGELETHPVFDHHPEHPELVLLYRDDGKQATENVFHTDTSFRAIPSMGAILRCLQCPPVGGDTIFVNMVLAYERLDPFYQQLLSGLYAVHDIAQGFGATSTRERRAQLREATPPQEHSVVRVHPETGEKILYVNQGFTTHLSNFRSKVASSVGSERSIGSIALLQYLFQQPAVPEYQVRLRWRPNTVAFWDNRSTQHYAVQDYYPAVRRMQRATIIGDRPV